MAINTIGLIIFIIGIVLILAEAAMPGTFIVVPGIALMIVGALIMAVPTLGYSAVTAVVFLVAFAVAFIPVFMLYKRIAPPGRPRTLSSDALIGRTGFVTREVTPGNIRGKVKIENELWSATSDMAIPTDTKVEVLRVEGVKVIVRPIAGGAKEQWVEDVLEVEA